MPKPPRNRTPAAHSRPSVNLEACLDLAAGLICHFGMEGGTRTLSVLYWRETEARSVALEAGDKQAARACEAKLMTIHRVWNAILTSSAAGLVPPVSPAHASDASEPALVESPAAVPDASPADPPADPST